VIEYLYNLDYTDALPDDLINPLQPNGHASDHEGATSTPDGFGVASTLDGFAPESPVVATNGFNHPESPAPAAPLEERQETLVPETEGASLAVDNEPLDDFLNIKKSPVIGKKKNKKKNKGARAKSISEADAETPAPAPEDTPSQNTRQVEMPTSIDTTTTTNGNGITNGITNGNPPPPIESPPTPPPPPTTTTTQLQTTLTTHAKLYSLSAKYGISELQALALSKFQSHAQSTWDANDFVHAAGEVYSSPLLLEESHGEMRRAVTGLLFGHRELLDGEGEGTRVKEILRGELGVDLIMRFREEGVW